MKKTLTITYDPDKCSGALVIGDTRLPVETALDACLNGYTTGELCQLYELSEEEAEVCGRLAMIVESFTAGFFPLVDDLLPPGRES